MNQEELYEQVMDNLLIEDDEKWDEWFDSLSEEDQEKAGKFTQQVFKSPSTPEE